MRAVDLNADAGEGFDDDGVLASVTSVNVACGFHAGDETTMHRVCTAAAAAGVVVGAHVAYRDPEGFGRRELDLAPHVIRVEVAEQVAALQEMSGGRVAYVKPHGALYHRASRDAAAAEAIIDASAPLPLLAFARSALLERARVRGLAVFAEGFADRGYAADGTLLPRGTHGALRAPAEAATQAVELARGGGIDSICVHSDTDAAAAVAAAVRAALEGVGFVVRPFA